MKSPSSTAAEEPRWRMGLDLAVPLVAMGLTVLLFLPIVHYSFVNVDDNINIFANPHIVPVAAQRLGYFWAHSYYNLYMPVTYTLWGLLARIAPLAPPGLFVPGGSTSSGNGMSLVNPAVFHGVSIALHTMNVLLVYLIALHFGFRPAACAAGALFFGIHPLQVESVAWSTGMNNLTGGLFSLLALLFYVRAARAGTAREARPAFVAATLWFCLALLSKPTSTAVPIMAAVLEWGVMRRPVRRWLPLVGSWAVLSGMMLVVTRIASSDTTGHIWSPLWGRPFLAGDTLCWDMAHVLWPGGMYVNYGRTIPLVLGNWWGYVTWLAVAAVAVLLWRIRDKDARQWLQASAGLFVAATLPVVGLFPFYFQEFSTVADRYLYLAFLGLAVGIAWALSRPKTSPLLWVAVAAILVAAGVRSGTQIPVWQDTLTLATNGVQVNPNDAAAHANYGLALALRGRPPQEAMEQFRAAAQLEPGHAQYHYDLSVALAAMGDDAAAAQELETAVRLRPDWDDAWFRLGVTCSRLHRTAETVRAMEQRLRLRPQDAQAQYIAGVALANDGRYREAVPHLQEAVRLGPDNESARHALSEALAATRQRAAPRVP